MNTGMLWFDNDKSADLITKISRAASYYHDKYGRSPNLCYIHPNMVINSNENKGKNENLRAGSVEVRTSRSVMPNHFWIGINGTNGSLTT